MKHAITNQLKELKHLRNSQQLRTPLDVSGVLFDAVRGWVSHEALRKVQEQRHLLHRLHGAPCSHRFTASHGLPCSHTLKMLEEEKETLSLEHFHPHWYLKRDAVQPRPILEPRRVTDVLTQNPTRPITSTRREPSEFERVDSQQKAPSKCSKCHTVGHTMTSRACPLRFADLLSEPLVSGPAVPVAAPHTLDQTAVSAHSAEPLSVTSHPPLSSTVVGVSAEAMEQTPASTLTSSLQYSRPLSSPNIDASRSADSSLDIETYSNEEAHCEAAPPAPPLLRYDSPVAIYARYVAERNAWYALQPSGSVKTNQEYRRAKGLPQRYNRDSYEWCLDYKQMSKRSVSQDGSREWTKEEMMAYLDWSKAEDERVEAQVAQEMGDKPFTNKRRSMKGLWELAEKDSKEQQALHSISGDVQQCIIVRTT